MSLTFSNLVIKKNALNESLFLVERKLHRGIHSTYFNNTFQSLSVDS